MDGSLQGRNLTMSGITFNPHQWHETCPWEGHRITIAVYTVKAVRTLDSSGCRHSEKTPVRAAIMKAAVSAQWAVSRNRAT